MQRLPLSVVAFVPFFAHGMILRAKAQEATNQRKETEQAGSCKPATRQSAIHLVQTNAAKVGSRGSRAMSPALVSRFLQNQSMKHRILHNQSTNDSHVSDAQDAKKTPAQELVSLAKGLQGPSPKATHKRVAVKFGFWPVEKMKDLAGPQVQASLANGSESPTPKATYTPVALKSRLGSIFVVRRTNLSTSSILVAMAICVCIVLICVCMVEDQREDADPPPVAKPKGVPPWDATLQKKSRDAIHAKPLYVSRRFESPPLPAAAAPHGFASLSLPFAAAAHGAVGQSSNDVQTVGHGVNGIHGVSRASSGASIPSADASLFSLGSQFSKMGQSLAASTLDPKKPDPICPDLVLDAESWYAVEFESIAQANGPIYIYGREKKLLLTAHIHHSTAGVAGSVTLALTMGGSLGPFVGSVTDGGGSLMLHDKRRKQYGEMIKCGELAFSLRCNDVEKVRFEIDEGTGTVTLVNPYDGTHLASAAETHDFSHLPSLTDYLGISVVAGMDPALTVLCIIGLMAFTQ